MRPYLAILKDSFREAMVSRVLWVLLVLATLMLALILPLSLTEDVAYELRPGDLRNATALALRMKAEYDGDRPAPGKQIWGLLQGTTKDRFESAGGNDKSDTPPEAVGAPRFDDVEYFAPFASDLNELLTATDMWDEDAWAAITLPEEAQELIDRDPAQLPDEKLGRLNRLLLEAAFPALIARAQNTMLYFTYAGYGPDWGFPGTIDGQLKSWLGFFVKWVIGVLGVVIGILVTSSIIPHTFEAGSIDLLLSKPVSRPLMYLTKFTGGCAFILLLSVYFVGGLWLIAGARYGFWSGQLLWCVPVLMFLFAVYYSVSALAGMIWRNAIVAVVLSVVFWGMCFLMWSGKTICDQILTVSRIGSIIETDQGVFVYGDANLNGAFSYDQWNSDSQDWDKQQGDGFPDETPIGTSLSRVPSMFMFRDDMAQIRFAGPDGKIISVREDGVYQSDRFDATNGHPAQLDQAVSTVTIKTSSDQPAAEKKDTEATDTANNNTANNNEPDADQQPQRVAPAFVLGSPFDAAMNSRTADLVIFDRTRLTHLKRNDQGEYDVGASAEIPGQKAGVVAFGGSTIVLATADGRIRFFDAQTLQLQSDFQPEGKTPPYMAQVSADGRYVAVLFHHEVLWLYDTQQERALSGIGGQGDIVSFAFGGNEQVLIAHHFTDVTRYDLDSMTAVETYSPRLKWFGRVYWYGVRVLYNLFPKPGELDDTVTYMIHGSKSGEPRLANFRFPSDDLRSRESHRKLNIWPPLWSNFAFMVLMLGLGCWYVQRKDF